MLGERNPKLRSRLSKQSWIWHYGAYDQLVEGFHERLSRLTELPHDLIEISEPMQVLEYSKSLIPNRHPCLSFKRLK